MTVWLSIFGASTTFHSTNQISPFPFLTHAFSMICSFFRKMSIKICSCSWSFISHDICSYDFFKMSCPQSFLWAILAAQLWAISLLSENWANWAAHNEHIECSSNMSTSNAHVKKKCSNSAQKICSSVVSLNKTDEKLDVKTSFFLIILLNMDSPNCP